ncbi:hopanoid biosynthesis associated radical SAM protein HpnJ [Cesiribacter andamanensis AMV16]|uniref:Hopanoid biosynthesis associated radical SAM protein HpnJ n=1 Tax=Cesiribacter andamanensis AMV16 TaxID=1279009 RepID=M7NHZ2_9BACT|nr:radical SAM protein [Cesiribacter andamanensis]EMR01435.1 hopanoid biosynthesis associated radical SAM protein HpnJ [Cesiribacter andamanensis AMV16]
MKVKMILPSLAEAKSPLWRPIKYSLFPPLGLATLASYLAPDDEVELQDLHVETLNLNDSPDLVVIQVYITNAYRAYAIADHYRRQGAYVVLGGLHVTSLPEEAARHADSIFLGPGEETFPQFLKDFRRGEAKKRYFSSVRTLEGLPPVRRDLIKRHRYLVPNSLVVTRGCPHHCSFCYKDAFFQGGKGFYTQAVDDALAEIERLPGKHLYFLDDHLLGNTPFAEALFAGMKGMNRVFQGASTVDAILRGDLIEKAADAGLRSLFVGFETFSPQNLKQSNKKQNLKKDYEKAVRRLHDLGIMINGSFVFGLDDDDRDVFKRTVDWGVENSLTTSTYHILTPYPGTQLYTDMEAQGRLLHRLWDLYDTRHVVYKTTKLSARELEEGYHWAYKEFYSWSNIAKAALAHKSLKHQAKHLAYAGGWKKLEPMWNLIINSGALNTMLPILEAILSKVKKKAMRRCPSLQDSLLLPPPPEGPSVAAGIAIAQQLGQLLLAKAAALQKGLAEGLAHLVQQLAVRAALLLQLALQLAGVQLQATGQLFQRGPVVAGQAQQLAAQPIAKGSMLPGQRLRRAELQQLH